MMRRWAGRRRPLLALLVLGGTGLLGCGTPAEDPDTLGPLPGLLGFGVVALVAGVAWRRRHGQASGDVAGGSAWPGGEGGDPGSATVSDGAGRDGTEAGGASEGGGGSDGGGGDGGGGGE